MRWSIAHKNIFIIMAHPSNGPTFVRALADAYEEEAVRAGHEVRRVNLGELVFDPILHDGYKSVQVLEPDLVRVQDDMRWAEHIVILYPNWWCTMPALLKGMFDRMFLPGFAFRFYKDGRLGWEQLLKGRSARVIVTMDSPPILLRLLFGDYTNEVRRGILGFAGIRPVRMTHVGPMKNAHEERRKHVLKKIGRLGRLGI